MYGEHCGSQKRRPRGNPARERGVNKYHRREMQRQIHGMKRDRILSSQFLVEPESDIGERPRREWMPEARREQRVIVEMKGTRQAPAESDERTDNEKPGPARKDNISVPKTKLSAQPAAKSATPPKLVPRPKT